ncbi:MAG: hypothetical protein WCO93_13030 [bacterium]
MGCRADRGTATPVSGAIGMHVACAAGIASGAWSHANRDLTGQGNTGQDLQVRQNIPSAVLSQ